MVNMSADDAVVSPRLGKIGKRALEVRDVRDRAFHLLLDALRKRIIGFAPECAVTVVPAIEPKEEGVAIIAQMRQPSHVRRYPVENISMRNEVTRPFAFQHIFFDDPDVSQADGRNVVEEIVMVAAHVDNLRAAGFHHFHQDFDKRRIGRQPFFCAVSLEAPAVDDVAVQNQLVAIDGFEEAADFLHLGMGASQMDIREDDRAIMFP